ncbi:hypothetical protein QE152_g3928 [Popillia japonica]|uniref:Uncharacterized protein n=1 Tax=Popillia japonica TaxID=7064 RepID=A0AAW1N281_POPJA
MCFAEEATIHHICLYNVHGFPRNDFLRMCFAEEATIHHICLYNVHGFPTRRNFNINNKNLNRMYVGRFFCTRRKFTLNKGFYFLRWIWSQLRQRRKKIAIFTEKFVENIWLTNQRMGLYKKGTIKKTYSRNQKLNLKSSGF